MKRMVDVLTKVNTSTSQPNDLSLRLKVVSSMQVPPPTPRRGCGVGGGTISCYLHKNLHPPAKGQIVRCKKRATSRSEGGPLGPPERREVASAWTYYL